MLAVLQRFAQAREFGGIPELGHVHAEHGEAVGRDGLGAGGALRIGGRGDCGQERCGDQTQEASPHGEPSSG